MSTPTILVIDDNSITRKLMRVTLEGAGYDVCEAEDGQTAVELMLARAPDLVIQDLLLPDIDGFALAAQLRALPGGAEIPILACSGMAARVEEAGAMSEFSGYLLKPVEPSRLLRVIELYLPAQAHSARLRRPGAGRRVLVVDDNPLQRKLLKLHLDELGFEVRDAADGLAALELARRDPPDAIVSDVLMPNLDGFLLCEAIRQDARLAHIPVMLTSVAYTEEEDRALALRVGANDLVFRSPDSRNVGEALLAVLERSGPAPRAVPLETLPNEYTHRVIRQLERQLALNTAFAESLAQREAELSALSGVAEAIETAAPLEVIQDEILYRCLDIAAASRGAAYLRQPDGSLALRVALGYAEAQRAALPEFFGHLGLLEQVLADGEPLMLPSPTFPASQALLHRAGARSLQLAPIQIGEQRLGVLAIEPGAQTGGFEQLTFARALGRQIGQVIALAHAVDGVRESELRFRTLVESIDDVVFTLDLQQRHVGLFGQWLQRYGIPPEALAGKTAVEALGPLAGAPHEAANRRALAGERVVYEWSIERPDGEFFFQTALSPRRDAQGHIVGVVGVGRDITALRRRTRELEAIAAVTVATRAASSRAEILPVILDHLLVWLRADASALTLREPAGETAIELTQGWDGWAGLRLLSGLRMDDHVIANGRPYHSDDTRADPRLQPPESPGAPRAVACVPLIARDQPIGALWVGRRTPFGDDELRLLAAVSDIAAGAIYRVMLYEQTERRLQRLAALRMIDMAISSSLDLRLTLHVLLNQVVNQLGIDAAAVLLLDPHNQTLSHAADQGFRTAEFQRARERLTGAYAARAAAERHMVDLPDLGRAAVPQAARLLAEEHFVAYVAVPLIAKGQVKGVLELFHRARLAPDQEWLGFLEMLAGQAGIAIDNAALFDDIQRSNAELQRAYDATIEGWARALDLRDKETEGHSRRVTELTVRLARAMGLDEAELLPIRRGALLHDIGKLGIPDAILHKPAPLNDDEWAVMRTHPSLAYEWLHPIAFLHNALDIPYCHHEKWDGSGYPRGLSGEQIPLAARIFALADAYDAMTNARPYRAALAPEAALSRIIAGSGTHFDSRVVMAFVGLRDEAAGRARVLVVDDEDAIVGVLARQLSDEYVVLTAHSGAEALELLAREEVAAIVTDQRMPGMSGVELLARARALRPSVAGVLMSGHADADALIEALNIGTVRGFVAKPWNIADLRRRLADALSQR